MRVKICGVNSAAALDAAAEAGADWIGLVFFARSPRHLNLAEAEALSLRAVGGPLRVGLLVQPTDAEVTAVLAAVPLDILQIYAPPARAAAVRARFGLPVWLACPIAHRAELPSGADGIDGLVIEARASAGDRPGGHGTALDWDLLSGWEAPAPWLLAGGLTPENVGRAVAESGADAVDVSSGVESAPGVKDPAKIAAFVRAARSKAFFF